MTRNIALVGIGKIARDQHVPAIDGNPDWTLAATVSRNANLPGIENHLSIDDFLTARPDVDTVSLAIPPQPRFEYASKALKAGRHVMLEKPPGASISECHTLEAMARDHGVSIFATWHSRFGASVGQAKSWLAKRTLKRLSITWKEDVRRWHPDQEWIWEPGGLGVFDPGINALSIMTEILNVPVHLSAATLDFPANRQTPIAAALTFSHPDGADVSAVFDWRKEGKQIWNIQAETTDGTLLLSSGGATLCINDETAEQGSDVEYAGLYRRMHDLVETGAIDMDISPLNHVADAFMLGRREIVDPFDY